MVLKRGGNPEPEQDIECQAFICKTILQEFEAKGADTVGITFYSLSIPLLQGKYPENTEEESFKDHSVISYDQLR